jgi:hypothetical protein
VKKFDMTMMSGLGYGISVGRLVFWSIQVSLGLGGQYGIFTTLRDSRTEMA